MAGSVSSCGIESTRYAFRTYKRLFYLIQEHQEKFLPEVTEAMEASESRLIDEQADVKETASALYDADKPELARKYLTCFSHTEAMHGLELAESMAAGIEARTKAIYGIRPLGIKPE